MAVKNGAAYLEEQISSILCQLGPGDELIVSDDHSSDSTLDIIRAYDDNRIRIYSSARRGIIHNFESALSRSSGDFVFLADQDDIWHSDKLSTMLPYFDEFDLVVCDCNLIGEGEGAPRLLHPSFFQLNGSGRGLLRNLISNSYMGCCMGFRRSVLTKAIPFPKDIAGHDFWIGMIAEAHFKPVFIENKLVSHRMHRSNASTSGRRSNTPPMKRVTQRYRLVRNLISRSL